MLKTFIFYFVLILALAGDFPNEPNRVIRVPTNMTRVEMMQAMREGHKTAIGHYPTDKRLLVGWSQAAIETRQGKEIYNYNFGNIGSYKNRPYYVKKRRYRAYKTSNEGAAAYWRFISERCRSSLKYFDKGDAFGAAHRLKACGYYEADTAKYGKAMVWLYIHAKSNVLPLLKKKE